MRSQPRDGSETPESAAHVPPTSNPQSLDAVASTGNRLETLRSLRDLLAKQVQQTDSGRDVAALSQRLMDVLGQIDVLSAGEKSEGTPLDEFTKRRAAKKPASRPARATRAK